MKTKKKSKIRDDYKQNNDFFMFGGAGHGDFMRLRLLARGHRQYAVRHGRNLYRSAVRMFHCD